VVFSKDKVFFIDVDGVLTDGKKTYDETGLPRFKVFGDKDFTALKELSAAGFQVVWVSGDDFINKAVAKNRNYIFISARGKCKGELIKEFIGNTSYDRIISVGDDVFDLPMALHSHHFYIPKDAYWRLFDAGRIYPNCIFETLTTAGGQGVIVEIAKNELSRTDFQDLLVKIEALDKAENF